MDHEALKNLVVKVVSEQLGIPEEEVKPEKSLVDDLGADSLEIVELVMAVEDELDMVIADDDAERWKTVQDMVDLVVKMKGVPA